MGLKSVFSTINKFDDQYMRPVRSVMFAGTLAMSSLAFFQADKNASAFEEFKAEFSEFRDQLLGSAANVAAGVNEKLEECDGNIACQAQVLRGQNNGGGQTDGSGATGSFGDAADPASQDITPQVIEDDKPSLRDRAFDLLNREP